jgi:ankyrin repeat protein
VWNAVRNRRYGDGTPWRRGDVVGCFLDLERRTIGFSLNGMFLGDAFTDVPDGLCPGLTLDKFQRATVNLGLTPFRFPPHSLQFRPAVLARLTPEMLRVTPLHLLATLPPDSMPDIATPLHWAAEQNHAECAQILLGAYPREIKELLTVSSPAEGPLSFAARTSAAAAIEVLLKVDSVDLEAHCNAALWPCCVSGDRKCFVLLGLGATPKRYHPPDSLGRSLLHVAAAYGRAYVIRACLAEDKSPEYVNARDRRGWTPLMHATHNSHEDCMQLLLEAGAAMILEDTPHAQGLMQPLLMAIHNASPRSLELLLDRGADPNFLGAYDMTPLMHAGYNGYIQAIMLLIERGADVNKRNARGKTAVHAACERGGTECAVYLLDHGAAADVKDAEGQTPLHACAYYGYAETALTLLERGVDPNCEDNHRGTPLQHAASRGSLQLALALMAHGAKLAPTLIWARPEIKMARPCPRKDHTMTVVGKHIVIFGGIGGKLDFGDLVTLDYEKATWTTWKGVIPGRFLHASCAIGQKMFVFGGKSAHNEELRVIDFSSGNPVPIPFNTTGDKPPTTILPAMHAVGDRIVVYGGRPIPVSVAVPQLYVLDTTSRIWTYHPRPADGEQPRTLTNASVLIGETIFLITVETKLDRLLWALDTRTFKLCPVPLRHIGSEEIKEIAAVIQPAVVAIGDIIYIFGG